MELELKYLAPYLPYGLKIKILNYKCDYVGIEYSEAEGFYLIGNEFFITYKGGSTGKSINDFKPILRPLSDFNDFRIGTGELLSEHIYKETGIHLDAECDICTHRERYLGLDNSLRAFNFLHQYHFDLFCLIPAGLAIDINTLNQ